MAPDRKKEVVNKCLDHFIENGLDTSTRSLSSALQLQNAGLYYYFGNKDEAVILCAEEAALRLEKALLPSVTHGLDDPDKMMEKIRAKADKSAPTMRFFVSVCVNDRYKESVLPILDRLTQRYDRYADKIAKHLGCDKREIEPYLYIAVTAIANYMIFKEEAIVTPQLELVKSKLTEFIKGGIIRSDDGSDNNDR